MNLGRRQGAAAVVLATIGTLLTGCAQVHSGSAQRADGFEANTVNPALLDTGNYPTKPRDPLGKAGTSDEGAILEGQRLADYVVIPFEVNPALTSATRTTTGVMATPDSVGDMLSNASLAQAIAPHHFVAGFAASNTEHFINVALLFQTDADANAAAADIPTAVGSTKTSALDHTPLPTTAVTIPGHPGTSASSWSSYHPSVNATNVSVLAVTTHQRLLLLQMYDSPADNGPDTTSATTLIGKTLDQQSALIDRFAPTVPDQLANLPMDPSGLRARMIPRNRDERTADNGSYGSHGALTFQPAQPVAAQKIFTEVGVDLFIYEDGFLTRTRDAAGAQALLDWEAADQASRGWQPDDGVPALPAARCQSRVSRGVTTGFWCGVTNDRLVLESTGMKKEDVRQKLAAGYLMLVTK